MKKAQEQEWTKHETMMGRIRATETVSLELRVASHRHPEGESAALKEAAAVLDCARAAPDMARALLALLPEDDGRPHNHTRECLRWRTEGAYITECLRGAFWPWAPSARPASSSPTKEMSCTGRSYGRSRSCARMRMKTPSSCARGVSPARTTFST